LADAQVLCAGRQNTEAALVSVTDPTNLRDIVRNHDIVISFVPAFLHPHVAKACIKEGKHMVTASYISPELQSLDELYAFLDIFN
jgi:alpha-aminoadipic semialdehyde synthase